MKRSITIFSTRGNASFDINVSFPVAAANLIAARVAEAIPGTTIRVWDVANALKTRSAIKAALIDRVHSTMIGSVEIGEAQPEAKLWDCPDSSDTRSAVVMLVSCG